VTSSIAIITGRAGKPLGRHRSAKKTRKAVAYWVAAVVLVVIFLAPYLWILASSFKSQSSIFRDVEHLSFWTFLPRSATLGNYRSAFDTEHVGQALVNSIIVSVAQVFCTLILCIPASYALTRMRFRFQGVVFGLIFVTFMVPAEALMLPLFQIEQSLHLSNTLPGVFLPWIANPFGIFLLRQAFREIPLELDEAAKIDGAGHFRVMWSVILPNVKPAIASLALMTFLFSWNSFLWPLIIVQSTSKQLIQVAIAVNTVPGALPNWGPVFGGAIIATLPVLILFGFLQRYFVRGMATSGLK
jgi:ABC-type glycerol-3-phosphate transport system permease component